MKKHLLLGLSILLLFATGCQKDKDQFIPYPLDGQIKDLINELLEDPISLGIKANTDQSFNISSSYTLEIDSESFTSNEDFIIEWTNAENAIQMDLHNLSNYSNGKYLSPSFTFNIDSPKEVIVDMDNPLELYVESDVVEDQALFYLSNEGWAELNSSKMIITEWTDDNGYAKSGFKVTIDHLGWYTISSKVELGSETFSNFCTEMEGQYTQSNSKSLIILENDIVIPMSRSANNGLFCTTMNIPVDQPITLLSISNLRDGEYELYYLETQMENGLIVAPVMEVKSLEEIKAIIKDI